MKRPPTPSQALCPCGLEMLRVPAKHGARALTVSVRHRSPGRRSGSAVRCSVQAPPPPKCEGGAWTALRPRSRGFRTPLDRRHRFGLLRAVMTSYRTFAGMPASSRTPTMPWHVEPGIRRGTVVGLASRQRDDYLLPPACPGQKRCWVQATRVGPGQPNSRNTILIRPRETRKQTSHHRGGDATIDTRRRSSRGHLGHHPEQEWPLSRSTPAG